MSANSFRFWKVRPRPNCEIRFGALPTMSSPLKTMAPRSGGTMPERMFSNVVLPAPFGPISEWMWPVFNSMLTSRVVTTPP